MIVDTSAVLAILQDEPERRRFNEAIEMADSRRVSAATFVESSIVIEARVGASGLRTFDRFLERADIKIMPVDVEQALRARSVRAVRQGATPRGTQLRRLLRVRACEGPERAAAHQR